jgi:phage gp29-like protein
MATSTILDQYGRPFEMAQLRESQTARTAWLQREFQNHPSRGLTPDKLASILLQAEQGDLIAQAELWQDMEEKDGHLFAEMHKRKLALIGLDWDILPPVDASAAEKEAAKDLKRILEDVLDLGDIVMDMANAIGVAYACQEITWRRDGQGWLPERVEFQEASWFTVDQATRKELRLRNGASVDGEALWPMGWIVHVQKSKSGYIGRAGLGRVLAWPYLFKNFAAQDLAEFLRIYGLPTKIGHYPPSASDKEKATLLKALLSIGRNAAGIMPDGMTVDLLDAAQGQADPFQFSLGFWQAIQSKAILGSAMTADFAANGNRSLGDIGNEIRKDIRASDAKQHAKTLSRDLVYPIGVLNKLIPDPRRRPRFVFDTQEPEDLKLYSEAIPALVDVGMPITVAQVQEKLKLRPPEENEAVLARAAAPASTPAPKPAALAARHAGHTSACPVCAASAGIDQPDPLDDLRDLALDGWRDAMTPVVNPLIAALDAAVAKGEPVAEFRARLPELLDGMDIAQMTSALTDAAFVARLAGEVGIDINAR